MLKSLFSRQSSDEKPAEAPPTPANGARRRVMVIGLDCAAPELIFDRWLDDLPNMKSLYEQGVHGELRSCDPPITVPAWSVMMSSKSPGRLGVYGFRNRADHSYDRYSIANSLAIKEDRLWEILTQRGKRSIVIGVPGTYPPKPLNGGDGTKPATLLSMNPCPKKAPAKVKATTTLNPLRCLQTTTAVNCNRPSCRPTARRAHAPRPHDSKGAAWCSPTAVRVC